MYLTNMTILKCQNVMIMFPEKVANQEGHGKADLQFDWLIILTQTF